MHHSERTFNEKFLLRHALYIRRDRFILANFSKIFNLRNRSNLVLLENPKNIFYYSNISLKK